jgi:hypothetical protein
MACPSTGPFLYGNNVKEDNEDDDDNYDNLILYLNSNLTARIPVIK